MQLGLEDLLVAVFSGSLGTVLGTAGGAYGATLAVKKDLQQETELRQEGDTKLDLRTDRLEQRVGLTRDGALTGNGIITIVRDLSEAVVDLQTRS